MNAQDLKNSILQLAIQGKLVEQRKEEGNAKELVEKIKQEKKRLIKEKIIKKETALDELTDEEIPFDIPGNWQWVKLGEIVSVNGGKRIPAGRSLTDEDTGYKYIRVADMKNGSILLDDIKYIPHDIYLKIKNYTISKDDIYITVAGTIGQVGLVPEELDNANLTENADKLVIYFNFKEFMYYMLSSNFIQYQIKEHTTKVGQPKLAIKRIKELIIPLPPLAEQKRIVAKIEELMPYVDKYDIAYSEVEELNKKFPEDMQKSILQYAIQGKLVEQREEDGKAEDLYKQIQEEKEKLIREGKIKKSNPLPEIKEDEIPFDIPENWKWVRLGDLGSYRKGPFGSALTKAIFVPKSENTVKVYEQKNAIQKDVNLGEYYITREYFESKMKGFELFPGDIIVSCAGTIGETYIMPDQFEQGIINQALMQMKLTPSVNVEYFLLYFDFILKKTARQSSKGSAIKNIPPFEELKSYLVPIPPLAEQKRIIERIEELLPYTKQLAKKPD